MCVCVGTQYLWITFFKRARRPPGYVPAGTKLEGQATLSLNVVSELVGWRAMRTRLLLPD